MLSTVGIFLTYPVILGVGGVMKIMKRVAGIADNTVAVQ